MKAAIAISLLTGAALAVPALACSPAPVTPGEVLRDDQCGVTYRDDEYTSRGIGGATDLGAGFVGQFYVAGNACYGSVSMIVTDCTSGKAVVFGPSQTQSPTMSKAELARDPFERLREQVEKAAASGGHLTLAQIKARAQGQFINNDIVSVRKRIGISNTKDRPKHRFDLSCGCGIYYPESAGAR